MATVERTTSDRLTPIKEAVARAVAGRGLKEGSGGGATLRIELEDGVRRSILAYWTAFEANIPGESIGLHLEVAEPLVRWGEAYLSPDYRNWVFFFSERASDNDIQLVHYADFATPSEALDAFFDKAAWYTLLPTDKSWDDVDYVVADDVGWSQATTEVEAGSIGPGVQESLKKSTIVWLRWKEDGVERTMPVWFVYDNKASKLYVLSGERQQTIPGAERLRECDVIFRWKGKNARIGEVPAQVRVIPHGAEWDEIAEKVAEKRLNIPGLPEDTARRWRDECVLLEMSLLA